MTTHSLKMAAACLGLGLLVASSASAGMIPVESGDTIKLFGDTGLPRYDGGGAFRADNLKTAEPNDLITFCLERDEYISFDTPYRAELGTVALMGGQNTDAGDPLDSKTAYLFSNFHHGTNGGGLWSTADLQEAIWFIEEELTGYTLSSLSSGAQTLVNLAQANKNESLYDVRVMNLYDTANGHCQSMLTVVPEPATVVLWSICGVCSLLFLRHRRQLK